jgi:outer membrane protein assembly factor BamA
LGWLPLAAAAPSLLMAQREGFTPILRGLPPDSGFALGVEYRRSRLARGWIDFNARAISSTKKYENLEVRLEFPELARAYLFADLAVRYRNYPEEDFWGLGQYSSRSRRTTFRHEDIGSAARFGTQPRPWLRAGFESGVLNANTGPGQDRDRPSIEERFTAAEVPALDAQPHFTHWGAFLELDNRDRASDATRGGYYALRWRRYHDRTLGRYHFRRWELDLRHFFRPFRPDGTVAARAAATFSQKDPGQAVPFFLQPTLGGGNDLRGYHQYRFRDENSLALNLEYRWQVREFVELVMFGDAGRVFARPGQFGLRGLRGSAGVGGRFKFGRWLLVGLDMAWSPEGPRFWFRGSQAF